MSLLRWIGEEDTEESVLPPLPKVYRLDEPETSAEDSSADFSVFSAFGEEADASEPEWPDEEDDISAEAAPAAFSRRYTSAAQELPRDGVILSDIRPTRRGRMALFFRNAAGEEEFLFSVDEETCALQHLKPGTRLSSVELEAVRNQSDLRRAKDRARHTRIQVSRHDVV